jgi:hypothetical protein
LYDQNGTSKEFVVLENHKVFLHDRLQEQWSLEMKLYSGHRCDTKIAAVYGNAGAFPCIPLLSLLLDGGDDASEGTVLLIHFPEWHAQHLTQSRLMYPDGNVWH